MEAEKIKITDAKKRMRCGKSIKSAAPRIAPQAVKSPSNLAPAAANNPSAKGARPPKTAAQDNIAPPKKPTPQRTKSCAAFPLPSFVHPFTAFPPFSARILPLAPCEIPRKRRTKEKEDAPIRASSFFIQNTCGRLLHPCGSADEALQ
ncbi:MAG: hypothetical protein IKU12_06180, partial [Oscillospiraceae bacterium]|nr:hypothetical protein [Oscillospiraceae bacterium]